MVCLFVFFIINVVNTLHFSQVIQSYKIYDLGNLLRLCCRTHDELCKAFRSMQKKIYFTSVSCWVRYVSIKSILLFYHSSSFFSVGFFLLHLSRTKSNMVIYATIMIMSTSICMSNSFYLHFKLYIIHQIKVHDIHTSLQITTVFQCKVIRLNGYLPCIYTHLMK